MGTENYKILLDSPCQNPALGFGQYADALKEIIETSEPRFAVGIFGGWGSGKTTLMQAIEARLDKTQAIPVWFSAWRYEKEPHLIVPLLDAIREALMTWVDQDPDSRHSEVVRETASTLGKVAASLLAGFQFTIGVPEVAKISMDAGKALEAAA
jgi:predicted KAP-like P-loop ATPase